MQAEDGVRKFLLTMLLATAHFFASFVAVVFSFAMSMNRFEEGDVSVWDRVLRMVSDAILIPLAVMPLGLLPEGLRTVMEYALFFANSLLWGVVLYAVGSLIVRRVRGQGS
jgi:hypothetical protein